MQKIKINLKEIFWKNGRFVDSQNRPVNVMAIGIPHNFESDSVNTIKNGENHGNLKFIETRKIRKFLNDKSDITYHEANAYSKNSGYYFPPNTNCHIPVNFYKIIEAK